MLLRVEACGVCGSDLRRWNEGPLPGAAAVIPGHEAAGVVLETGPQCSGFTPGDRLAIAPDIHCGACYYCRRGLFNLCDHLQLVGITPGIHGAFADQLVLTRRILENGIVHAMPAGMPFSEAAFAEPACSVLSVYQRFGVQFGETIVVIGAGPIGCLFTFLGKIRNARVIVSEASAARRDIAARFQPDALLDPGAEDPVQRVRELTQGVGADLVICANPVAATQTLAVEMVRKRGRVVLFGGLPKADPMTRLDANRVHYGEIEVAGAFSYHPVIHETALDLIHRKIIPADRFITHTFPLEHIREALAAAASATGLKVLVERERRLGT